MNTVLPFTKSSIKRKPVCYDNESNKKTRHTDSIYNYNNLGYRSNDDFIEHDISKKIMFLGCSMTEGIGVEYDKTWPVLVIKHISDKKNELYKNYNISSGGSGAEFISRAIYQTIDLYIPDLVIILWPFIDRREYFIDINNSINIHINGHLTESKRLMFNELRNEFNDFYNTIHHLIFVETLLESRNIKRIHSTYDQHEFPYHLYINSEYWMEYDRYMWWKSPRALDHCHPGNVAHENFSKILIDRINSLNLI